MVTLQIQTAKVFEPLLAKARYKGAHGGRSAAKSHFFAESAVEKCLMQPGARIVCVREVQRALKESVKRLLEDKIIVMGVEEHFGVLFDTIITPGNGIIVFQGMADHTAESIKSLEGFDVAYVEEAQTLTARSLELLRPTIRKKGSELWFSWNPRNASDPVDELLRGPNPPPNSIVVKTTYLDNPFFPAEAEAERAYDEIHNPERYAHIWLGEYEPQAIGAIWDRAMIQRNRRDEAPKLTRILVAVDPPISSAKGADEAGIVAGGIGEDGRGYVLADYSSPGTPEQWARRALAAYDLYEADAIIAEVNQGGEMVTHTIHSVRSNVRVIPVRAFRGKHLRAEPISALYSLDRISHVGTFPDLEAQMCLTTPLGYEGEKSPNNMDAMVYLFTELFPKMVKKQTPAGLRPVRATNQYRPLRWKEHAR